MDYDYQTLEDAFKKVPYEVQLALSSTTIVNTIRSIGEGHNLTEDQVGALMDQTTLVLLNLTSPADFAKNLVDKAIIPGEEADNIAHEIDSEVFQPAKNEGSVNAKTTETNPLISSVEQAGGFEIVNDGHIGVPGYGVKPKPVTNSVNLINKSDQASLRYTPEQIAAQSGSMRGPNISSNTSTDTYSSQNQSYSEPLVDQLLRAGAVVPKAKTVVGEGVGPTLQPRPQNQPPRSGPDPYREVLK